MTTLQSIEQQMTGADLGADNPLPPLGTLGEVQNVPAGEGVPEEMQRNMKYGWKTNPLPYTVQDGYSRDKQQRTYKTIVLENEFLKATFLPEYGGRLWSLFDKVENRDLIYENPVIQPANLAIRNAWLSGGVEWNIGLRGHSPFTCSNVFAGRVDGDDGVPILRMYEYERIRQVPYSVDYILPHDSRLLFVYVRIVNPHDTEVPMYWWSNIAYPEHPETRVVVPAEQAFRFGYGQKGLNLRDMPVTEGVDVSYSVNLNHSADFFFDIPDGDRKWVSAIDKEGVGLFQSSVDRLMGRKLFLWGSGAGGNAWQAFLAKPGDAYIEIQAGLAHTQMEHIPMPAQTEWNWLEAYGCVKADPKIIHGGSWKEAYTLVGNEIEKILSREEMKRYHSAAVATADSPITERYNDGSGWGMLETEYRKHQGLKPLTGSEFSFSRELESGQAQWLELLTEGTFPCPNPLTEPVGFEVEEKWLALLNTYTDSNGGNWYAWLHCGLMLYAKKDLDGAVEAWQKSISASPNPWAHRNLGQLSLLQDNLESAVAHYESAFGLVQDCRPLTIEYGLALLKAGKAETWLEIIGKLPAATQAQGRFQLLLALGLLGTGKLDEALAVIEKGPQVTDLREGENSLTDIWYRIHEQKVLKSGEVPAGDLREYVEGKFPPPAAIDFRMRTKKTAD